MGYRSARSVSLVILCFSDNVIPVLAIKSEPHSGESSWGYFFRSYQECMAACWGVWLELVLLSNSIPHEPILYLGTTTSEAFGNKDLMCQAVPIFLLQLTKIRSGILNLHLNLHVGHLILRSTICKINNPSVPLDLPDGCC